jgi:CubicO group peptidase (beta-lactamase class C family)
LNAARRCKKSLVRESISMAAGNKDLRAECEILLRQYGVPAVGLARIVPTGVEAIEVLGERRHGSGVAVTVNDLWHTGSCTKSMTATMLARLVEQGYLNWDSTVGPIFAAQGAEVNAGFEQITSRHLLAHQAGMPAEPYPSAIDACFTYNELWEQRAAFAFQTLAEGPAQTPGQEFCYSNTGYIVAGALAEAVTGQSWEELMRQEFFGPLGLRAAGFGAPGKGSSGGFLAMLRGPGITQPWGHMSSATALTDLRPDDEQADNPPFHGPAGTVHISLPDLGRYVAYHASGGALVPDYLSPETVELLHTPQFDTQYAFGWMTAPAEEAGIGKRVIWHEGTNEAWFTSMLVVPDDQCGLAFVCNGHRESMHDAETGVGIALLEIYGRWVDA